jgi:hypothetical protein
MELLEEFLGSELVGAASYAALFTILFMLLIIKGAIYLLFESLWKSAEPVPEDWPLRSLVINFVTFLVATGIVFGRYQFDWLTSLMCGLLAAAFVIAGYEPIKNLLGAIGFDLEAINLARYFS